MMTVEEIRALIKEHEQAVERGLRTIDEMRQQAAAMQQQAGSIMVDVERRRGALIDLRRIAGLPLDGSEPKQVNSVGQSDVVIVPG